MQARRQCLWDMRGGYPQLHRELQDALAGGEVDPDLPTGSSVVSLRDQRVRDVLAIAAVDLACRCHGGHAFGGWVRAMVSGEAWDDVDLFFDKKMSIAEFKHRLPEHLRLVFALACPHIELRTTYTQSRAGYSFEFHRHQLIFTEGGKKHIVQLDITTRKSIAETLMRPCSVGSSLVMTRDGVRWCSVMIENMYGRLEIADAKDLLRSGRDIQLWPDLPLWDRIIKSNRDCPVKVRRYHERAVGKLRRRGFNIVAAWGTPADEAVPEVD